MLRHGRSLRLGSEFQKMVCRESRCSQVDLLRQQGTGAEPPSSLSTALDDRLEATGTEYLDLYFWHAMGDHREAISFPKSREFARAVEAIKKSGKANSWGSRRTTPAGPNTSRRRLTGGFVDVDHAAIQPVTRTRIRL